MNLAQLTLAKPAHDWLRSIYVSYVPGPTTPVLDEVTRNLFDRFNLLGHHVQDKPDDRVDVIVTTAPFGDMQAPTDSCWYRSMPISPIWRRSLARRPS